MIGGHLDPAVDPGGLADIDFKLVAGGGPNLRYSTITFSTIAADSGLFCTDPDSLQGLLIRILPLKQKYSQGFLLFEYIQVRGTEQLD